MKKVLIITLVLVMCFAITANAIAYSGYESYSDSCLQDNYIYECNECVDDCDYNNSISNQIILIPERSRGNYKQDYTLMEIELKLFTGENIRIVPPTSHCSGYTMSVIGITGWWDSIDNNNHQYTIQYIWECNRDGCNGKKITIEKGTEEAHSWQITDWHEPGATTHDRHKVCRKCDIVIDLSYRCPGNPCIYPRN